LTDDYQMMQKLLLSGILITYEPAAIGCSEAPKLGAGSDLSEPGGCAVLEMPAGNWKMSSG
jgi:hypothetical protein